MPTVQKIYDYIDAMAPFSTQMDFDNAGLLVGDKNAEVSRVLVALDATQPVVREAARRKCQLLVTHHPLIFHPLKSVVLGDPTQAVVAELVRKNMALICAHTNLDAAPGGVNDVLMDRLGVKVTGILDEFGVGDRGPYGMGRVGELSEPLEPKAFAAMVKRALGTRAVRAVPGTRAVQRVAVCGGSGGDMVELAASLGMDAYVTADVKHHEFLLAQALGITLVDAGHYATENPVTAVLADGLRDAFGAEGVEVFLSKTHKEPYFAP